MNSVICWISQVQQQLPLLYSDILGCQLSPYRDILNVIKPESSEIYPVLSQFNSIQFTLLQIIIQRNTVLPPSYLRVVLQVPSPYGIKKKTCISSPMSHTLQLCWLHYLKSISNGIKTTKLPITLFLHYPITSSLTSPNSLLSTLPSNTNNLPLQREITFKSICIKLC